MENIHGIDVSWIHNTHSKDSPRISKIDRSANPSSDTTTPVASPSIPKATQNGGAEHRKEPAPVVARQIPQRPGVSRTPPQDKTSTINGAFPKSPPIGTTRRNSWLSSISSKFSSSPVYQAGNAAIAPLLASTPEEKDYIQRPPGVGAPKNAILPHASKPESGSAPYIPVPPKAGHPNFLQSALRRLSSSGGQLSAVAKGQQHGLCERRVLNVDRFRERCLLPELDQAKLRRVAFCVDVEIASGPRYNDEPAERLKEKKQKKKMVDKSEGEALKHPQEAKEEREKVGVIPAIGEEVPKELAKGATEKTVAAKQAEVPEKDQTKKKEKKKRSEEERKARKEKKRKLAEESGIVPCELVRNDSESSLSGSPSGSGTPKSSTSPTTDPLRIYRRCCQLRETPILKKITEQLAAPSNSGTDTPGVVRKLDLTDTWLQLPDLVTFGDYLAVVPVKELVMENCGLTDEGVRVILAGLLAAAPPDYSRRKKRRTDKSENYKTRGVVQRVVFKNNPKIGRDGWRHISLFTHMSRSLKCLDLSLIPFPQPSSPTLTPGPQTQPELDAAHILSKAIATRLAGPELELLNVAATGLTTEQVGVLIDGVIKSGLKRLGLAENHLTAEGVSHVARFLKEGQCEGLDIGGNNLSELIPVVADALGEEHPLFALSLANCDLTPDALWALFPALVKLKNFRFIDLSHNHELFATRPSAVYLLRTYLPKMPSLKRIHLTDVSMSPEQAIALAEIFPDTAGLAHVNLLENPELSVLANATDEANQEEACALYASLMAAVRVSKSLVCIDIDVPTQDSSEVVKALAKQVVAYCLRNMERGPVAEITQAVAALPEPHGGEKEVAVPDVLLHLVGHIEGMDETHDDDDPAPDEDYVIGGTGVVKALGICLKNRSESRRPSIDRNPSPYDVTDSVDSSNGTKHKAKNMSKNLLDSARKIRARLQPALVKEARGSDRISYHKLLFLDQTLERMIKRFEDEYPETRLSTSTSIPLSSSPTSVSSTSIAPAPDSAVFPEDTDEVVFSDDEATILPMLSRHNSDVSLASKALSQEEGRMHRFGQKFRRDMLKPDVEDGAHGATGGGKESQHVEILRAMIGEIGGDEIRRRLEEGGEEEAFRVLGDEARALRERIKEGDPEGWEKFREAQLMALRNALPLKEEQGRNMVGEFEIGPVEARKESKTKEDGEAVVDSDVDADADGEKVGGA